MSKLKGVVVGVGYFSQFHLEAWSRMEEVQITAICDRDRERGLLVSKQFGVGYYSDYLEMLDQERPDFVDIITPPESHLELTQGALDRGVHVICQKPLAPTYQEASQLVAHAAQSGGRFMVHENWRFQPWYREMKRLTTAGLIGEVHSTHFRSRMGDGWGDQAYIPRQPYFREYPRLIVYENGIHFIDTFRFLFGEIRSVYARLRRLNPVIKGEDWAMIHFVFESGLEAVWDANRYNEPNHDNPRYTFGEMVLDGLQGSIRLYPEGRLTVQQLGRPEEELSYAHDNINFAGDCVYFTQRHFINCLVTGREFETSGPDYLKSLQVQEAVYRSAAENRPVAPSDQSGIAATD